MNMPCRSTSTSSLPLPADFTSTAEYVDSLLEFSTSSKLLKTLCGGIHVLDFFTLSHDVYESVFPSEWSDWFKSRDIMDILDLLMRQDVSEFRSRDKCNGLNDSSLPEWRGGPGPPSSLIDYIQDVRRHCLDRRIRPRQGGSELPEIARQVSVGMKAKKVHEVSYFSRYISDLCSDVRDEQSCEITHLVDFGSGQNYLGRALSTAPYNKTIIAIESKTQNIKGARDKDVLAKIVEKPMVFRDKKKYRDGSVLTRREERQVRIEANNTAPEAQCISVESSACQDPSQPQTTPSGNNNPLPSSKPSKNDGQSGSVIYVDQRVENGNMKPVLAKAFVNEDSGISRSLMTLSLHSCGNLLHHGLRTILSPEVSAVAMVGCCYNLLTERLGPPSYKLPGLELRSNHPRVQETSSARDPHGFPMSQRLAEYHPDGTSEPGVRFNITARMMAVQAPANWGRADSDAFFTRHFYRALLQRIFLDYEVIPPPDSGSYHDGIEATQPIIIGNLSKPCYDSFKSYVRGAIAKLLGRNTPSPSFSALIAEKLSPAKFTDENILEYERRFSPRKHDVAITWSMMAFSAGVVESVIVVDRWLWLLEQQEVQHAWVEAIFDYKQSPRNLVVVGVKKRPP